MGHGQKTLLCIDDQPNALSGWCLYLQAIGFAVLTAASAQEGLELFATNPVDAVIIDYSMPEMSGAEVAGAMKRIKPAVPVIMFSGVTDIPAAERQAIDALVVKGSPPQVLVQKIHQVLEGDDSAAHA